MLSVPSHLFQPLYIDTNISYDLDMSMFPGLDDPQQMYQPALMIATDGRDYVYDEKDFDTGVADLSASRQSSDNGLSTELPDLVSSCVDTETFQYLIDDVTRDTSSSCDCFSFIDCEKSAPVSSELSSDSPPVLDNFDSSDVSPLSQNPFAEVRLCSSMLPPFSECIRGQKRPISSEHITAETSKKVKMSEESLDLTSSPLSGVSVCPVARHTVYNRWS